MNKTVLQIQNTLIIDDQPLIQEALQQVVSQAFPETLISFAADLDEARAQLSERLQLILIDISLPDGSGLDLLPDIETQSPEAYPVVVSSHFDAEHINKALKLGAKGYLVKSDSKEDMISKLQGITKQMPPLSPQVAMQLLSSYHAIPEDDHIEELLTGRELQAAKLLAQGMGNKDAAQAMHVSPYTVADYVKGIYKKLEISSRAELAALMANHIKE